MARRILNWRLLFPVLLVAGLPKYGLWSAIVCGPPAILAAALLVATYREESNPAGCLLKLLAAGVLLENLLLAGLLLLPGFLYADIPTEDFRIWPPLAYLSNTFLSPVMAMKVIRGGGNASDVPADGGPTSAGAPHREK